MNADKRRVCFFICVHLCSSAVVLCQATAPADDERLYAELANRGLNTLLDRAFEANHVPPARQQGIRSLVALRDLTDPNSKLTSSQRNQLVAKIVGGIDQALPNLNDSKTLMEPAGTLISIIEKREVNTIEYWGESPKTQAALRPIITTIIKLLDKAAVVAQANVDKLANALSGPNDPKIAQLDEAQRLVTAAQYTKAMVQYYQCLALPGNDPERKKIADEAIAFLTVYDTPDSDVQNNVRERLAKLNMAKGDFAKVKEIFAGIATKPQEIKPTPTPAQQYTARYFSVVCDVLAKNSADATKGLTDLMAWQKTSLPSDKPTQDGIAAAAAMLQYRIHRLAVEQASDYAAKAQANDAATAVLINLVKQRPDLQGIIYEQLMTNLPASADLKSLDPLLLAALVRKGDEERAKPQAEPIDKAVMQRAIDAAKELVSRKGQAGVDNQIVENAALLSPFLLERLDRHAEAAQGFLDYIQQFPSNLKNMTLALDNAQATIAHLRQDKSTADAPATVVAYERFLPIAVAPPFNRKQFAYEYARRLQARPDKLKQAVEYFRQVPQDDKRIVNARFYELVAQQQRLDQEKLDPAERQTIVAQFQKLADDVNTRATAALKAAPTENDRRQFSSILARAALLAADVARREQKDANRTLGLLANFESVAAGLPNEKDLLASALYLRVQSYMALQKTTEATSTLVTLLKARPGGEGAAVVYNLLQKLNEDLDRARAANDAAQMKTLARDRAQLSGFLVEWAKGNADPNIKKFTYRYSVFDASTKQLAAELEQDPKVRRDTLVTALNLYRKLQSPDNVALYQATIDPKSGIDPAYPDPAVSLGVGLIQYDLGNYADAQKALGQLLTDRKLGTPSMTIDDNGTMRVIENDQYWEATLKLMRSNVALAKSGDEVAKSALDESKNYLKQLYIQWGPGLGGKKWNGEFEKLRAEIIPDFKPENLSATTAPVATK